MTPSDAPPTSEVDAEPGGPGLWWSLPSGVRLAIGVAVVGVLAVLVVTLREPGVAFEPPDRAVGQHAHDAAGALDRDAVEQRLAELSRATGVDVVVVAWEDEAAEPDLAARGARRLRRSWQADVAVGVVAPPRSAAERPGRPALGVDGERPPVDAELVERALGDPPGAALGDTASATADDADVTAALLSVVDELEAELDAERDARP